jgi:hypothetical protein
VKGELIVAEITKEKKSIIDIVDKYEAEISKLKGMLEQDIPLPMKANTEKINLSDFKFYGKELSLNSHESYWFKTKSYYGGQWSEITKFNYLDSRKLEIKLAIDNLELKYMERTVEEKLVRERNQIVQNKVISIMTRLGIDDYSTYELPSSRHRNKKLVKHVAGYKSDLNRIAPLPNTYEYLMNNQIKKLRETLESNYSKAKQFITNLEREEQIKNSKNEQLHKLAAMRIKYTPDNLCSNADEILESILAKDKYLMLASYLYRNRCDWSDGYDLAETGLCHFIVENDTDQKIYNEISEIIETSSEWCDGRMFRDSEFGYDYLFSIANKTLLEDYKTVTAIVGGL